ncbi:DUF3046 domain-containing protein [Propioniciclava flava]|uniref:DUF3046 domain-containing protein n=1 Tax=Propioniciclava flava TaxID=2072026 RepID=A0A4Q2EKR6_9ACTN|nr:DUF3046 domain-containing protein [Propioniciclava flava]RXW33366.1 DUF3046 domain-containing protein [Propioniciclava flava]
MREQELLRRIAAHVGAEYAGVWRRDVALPDLDHRTVDEALASGVPAQQVWRAVWSFLELPDRER